MSLHFRLMFFDAFSERWLVPYAKRIPVSSSAWNEEISRSVIGTGDGRFEIFRIPLNSSFSSHQMPVPFSLRQRGCTPLLLGWHLHVHSQLNCLWSRRLSRPPTEWNFSPNKLQERQRLNDAAEVCYVCYVLYIIYYVTTRVFHSTLGLPRVLITLYDPDFKFDTRWLYPPSFDGIG